jgi:hypothetical protein
MAAIARSSLVSLVALAAAAFGADTPRARVSYVASALTAGNPADAMSCFDKSFAGYEKLRGYFSGLTSAFQLVNQLEVTEEEDSAAEATLTIEWTLTLSDPQTGYAENRNAAVHARLALKSAKWKIVEFTPIELFDPQPKRSDRAR